MRVWVSETVETAIDRVGFREGLERSNWASGSRRVRALGSGLAMRRRAKALGKRSTLKRKVRRGCSVELREGQDPDCIGYPRFVSSS